MRGKRGLLLAVVILLVFGIFAFQGADIETYAKGTTSKWTVTTSKKTYAYTGKKIKPKVTVKYKGKKLKPKNYKVNFKVVNDKEEVGRIDVEEYEKAYYVACFTYDSDITDEHWREYGQSENKVLFGVKTSWFKKKLSFLDINHTKIDDNCFKICNSFDEAIDYQVKSIKNGKNVPPYYVIDYGFYKVIYDDILKKNIKSKAISLLSKMMYLYAK